MADQNDPAGGEQHRERDTTVDRHPDHQERGRTSGRRESDDPESGAGYGNHAGDGSYGKSGDDA